MVEDGCYSPIQRLIEQKGGGCFSGPVVWQGVRTTASRSPPDAKVTLRDAGYAARAPMERDPCGSPDSRARRQSSGEANTVAFVPECIDESLGATGDAWRFRYDKYSPEEGYSPIAAVHPWGRLPAYKAEHVWSTHEDGDGAVCSQAIHGPLDLMILLRE
jgi:hypothetical protein